MNRLKRIFPTLPNADVLRELAKREKLIESSLSELNKPGNQAAINAGYLYSKALFLMQHCKPVLHLPESFSPYGYETAEEMENDIKRITKGKRLEGSTARIVAVYLWMKRISYQGVVCS